MRINVLLLSLFTAQSALAQNLPHNFVSGTPARAAEVNANFEYLEERLNALDHRVPGFVRVVTNDTELQDALLDGAEHIIVMGTVYVTTPIFISGRVTFEGMGIPAILWTDDATFPPGEPLITLDEGAWIELNRITMIHDMGDRVIYAPTGGVVFGTNAELWVNGSVLGLMSGATIQAGSVNLYRSAAQAYGFATGTAILADSVNLHDCYVESTGNVTSTVVETASGTISGGHYSAQATGIGTAFSVTTGDLRVVGAQVMAPNYAVDVGTGFASIAYSQLSGGFNAPQGHVRCIYNYDSLLQPVSCTTP